MGPNVQQGGSRRGAPTFVAGAPQRRSAFSLVELLVVVAVIAILAGLIFPGIGIAKRKAKRTVCLNNLRQLTLADLLYFDDAGRFPLGNEFVPSSMTLERLTGLAAYLRMPLPAGGISEWPRRLAQPRWFNCPMATDSGYAEGVVLGGGVYTGYAYFGGVGASRMVSMGFATLINPTHAADAANTFRGVLWADVLDEFHLEDPRRFEFFHTRQRLRHPDFRFEAANLDGFHRAWSDASVEWVPGRRVTLGTAGPDLQIRHILGNYYY